MPAILMPFIALRVFGWQSVEISSSWHLRDVPAGRTFAACNTLMCKRCGMLFLDMRFDEEEMAALYDDYRGDAYTQMRTKFEPDYANRNSGLLQGSTYIDEIEDIISAHVVPRPRILDWGGDTGINTPFRSRSVVHHIYDISGRPLVDGAIAVSFKDLKTRDYDLIVFSNVLEHVPAPRISLGEIAGVMRMNTILYIEIPHEETVRNSHSPSERIASKRHWHEHINFFTVEALDLLLRDVGLRPLTMRSHVVSSGPREDHLISVIAELVR